MRGFYGMGEAKEQYYCNFGLNPELQALIDDGGLRVVGVDQNGEARILELAEHAFYVATLFVPQLTSTEEQPHPLIAAYLRAALACKEERASNAAGQAAGGGG